MARNSARKTAQTTTSAFSRITRLTKSKSSCPIDPLISVIYCLAGLNKDALFSFFPKVMINPDPEKRPSAVALVKHSVLLSAAKKSAEQLRIELNAEKFKNSLLQK